MEDQQEQQEQKNQETKEQLQEAGKQVLKMATQKPREALKKKIIQLIITKLLPIIGILIIICAVFVIVDKIITTVTGVFTQIASFVTVGDNGPLAPSPQEIYNKIDEVLQEQGIKIEDLNMGSEKQAKKYLFKFMSASLATQLPYIQGSNAETFIDIAFEDDTDEVLSDTFDDEDDTLNANKEVQGIVKIKRRKGERTKDLKFKKYEDLKKMIEEENSDVLDFFSIDENWMLCVAKCNTSKTILPDGTTVNEEETYIEVKIPYQTMVSKYSIPFEFFMTLQQISRKCRIRIIRSKFNN